MISDRYVKILKSLANITRVCPEMMIGLGSPRDSLRLIERKGEDLKLVVSKSGLDLTSKMNDFTANYIEKLKTKEIDGFILKAKSPSCGIISAKIYYDTGKSHVKSAKNAGVFGKAVLEAFPNVPTETERRISNFNIRDRFFVEIFTLAKYRDIKSRLKIKELVEFHSVNKYLFMGYNQVILRAMGNIVANHDRLPLTEVFDLYETQLRKLLSKEQTTKKRINVLEHVYGYYKDDLNNNEKKHYFDILDDYLNNKKPYSSVLSLLESWAIRFNQTYLIKQTLFDPYPKELLTVMDSGKNL
jgi:uncharacterized protein YbgA (DUF1722 family)/uncharacterized protein YbbK (DUF523 family)